MDDSVRSGHSGFNIRVDGPYQVIGVDYHERESVQVWDDYVAYAPWSGYTCVDGNPYGWNYGVVYSPGLFVSAYNGWYGGWVGYGSPAFVGFYGYGGPMVVAGLSVNIGLGFGIGIGFGGFYANASLGGYYHSGPRLLQAGFVQGRIYLQSLRLAGSNGRPSRVRRRCRRRFGLQDRAAMPAEFEPALVRRLPPVQGAVARQACDLDMRIVALVPVQGHVPQAPLAERQRPEPEAATRTAQ